MTDKHTSQNPARVTPNEARGGRPVKGMPYVLGLSIGAVVILGVILALALM